MAEGEGPRSARLLELTFHPGLLLLLFVFGEIGEVIVVVAIQDQARDQRIFRREIYPVPFGRHRPAGSRMSIGVGKFGGHFVKVFLVVIVVAEHGPARPWEDLGRIHVFKTFFPTRRGDAAFHGAVEIVSQHEKTIGLEAAGLRIALHGRRHLRLHAGRIGIAVVGTGFGAFLDDAVFLGVAKVSEHEEMQAVFGGWRCTECGNAPRQGGCGAVGKDLLQQVASESLIRKWRNGIHGFLKMRWGLLV